MSTISLVNIRQGEKLPTALTSLKSDIEKRINLKNYSDQGRYVLLSNNLLQRIALFAGLSLNHERDKKNFEQLTLSRASNRIHETTFSRFNLTNLWSALLKLRYHKLQIDWEDAPTKSKIINAEMMKGIEYLTGNNNLEEWLFHTPTSSRPGSFGEIPELDLVIGNYEDDIQARINLNSREIPNTQIIIAGSTGSGKSNLLAVLINEMRIVSTESAYPVNFLLFDYKGEFSDPANRSWLNLFEVDETCILDPVSSPLPFTPFEDFTGQPQNAINLYATELSNALCAIDAARISANMNNRLAEAVINAYRSNQNKPVTFDLILQEYTQLQPENDRNRDDSVKSVLKQLIRNQLFDEQDSVDLIKSSLIIKMNDFPKDGPIAKAIVYFIVSKLNTLYEKLPKQAVNEKCVEIRHFTIIDEAHYMLDFDNKPLRDLIAVGRNKGLSIILATQNMESFKSKHFDFYANAQYPLIMKQQSIADGVIKDLFGVSGQEFNEIKEAISNLKLGELIIKNPTAVVLGIGKKYKKIKVTHLI
jgi:energy-coupling factor transporter ATP-binding protein EcfA2